ncbi:CLUMA_CG012520, isoform A [Clunio marinus]|uniref:CLUMA_CG012520, isoform A n=1 Tax=Clunio marinus TaxID=568069 RepID=A0A1J1IFW0_9DIPT|nr:CLUMA_CG012520, isoform A [Clunio marinus]
MTWKKIPLRNDSLMFRFKATPTPNWIINFNFFLSNDESDGIMHPGKVSRVGKISDPKQMTYEHKECGNR